jgi:NADPH-dependent 2,4-dienoyl-CoA reductase/sulfur reductase-like enzyme/nitrite reductase/ring-hydroxylating ferredoxin subunit
MGTTTQSVAMQDVAALDEVPVERAIRVKVSGVPVLLVRDGERVHAYGADCPHAGAPLEKGGLCNGRIVCPWHKGTFAIADGRLVEPPALEGLKRYPVRLENGRIFVSPNAAPAHAHPRADNDGHASAHVHIIIGAGAAGAAACAALREYGFDGRVLLIGKEPGVAYDRTSLSKFVVAGDMAPDSVPPVLPPDFYERHHVERFEAEVVRLDAAKQYVELAHGRRIDYDAALVCTGGVPKPMKIPGIDLGHVHTLRSREDARAILASLREGARAVIVGSSFIGLEVASSLRKLHVEVTVVSPDEVPFAAQFGATIGEMFTTLHLANGVKFRMKSQVKALEGDTAVRRVMLENGEGIEADLVIIGTGVKPATAFLEGVVLADDGGIPVDASMRAGPALYGAGDIARFPLARSGKPARIEHWRVAQQHARIAAHNMADAAGRKSDSETSGSETSGNETYTGVPYFWTYHFGKRFDYLGHADGQAEVVVDGSLSAQAFIAYQVEDGRVAAVIACDREAATARLAEAMREPLTLADARRVAAVSA